MRPHEAPAIMAGADSFQGLWYNEPVIRTRRYRVSVTVREMRVFILSALRSARDRSASYTTWERMEELEEVAVTEAAKEFVLTAQEFRDRIARLPPDHVFGEATAKPYRIFERYCRENLPSQDLPPIIH